jgi:hypothetical protein
LIAPRAIDRLLLEQPKPPWLVAWIEFGVHLIGRRDIDRLILFSTVVPYAFLMTGVILIGQRLSGAWGGFLALVCLASSPYSLAFGGKVMVETYLALWVLLIYGLTALFLTAPSRKKAAALGFVVGLALLTKLTIALFLPGPLIFGCVQAQRGALDRLLLFRKVALSIAVCLAVAGPWYLRNARSAVRFAIFSSQYNEIATGLERVPLSHRLAEMASYLAGWPLLITIAGCATAVALFPRKQQMAPAGSGGEHAGAEFLFQKMAWVGAGIAAAVLLCPTYFDCRFLLPIWPVLAVAIGSRLSLQLTRLPAVPRSLIGLGCALSLVFASAAFAREPLFRTYWKTTVLIDELVSRFGVSNLVNVGNCAAWNVCKTGLMNELREHPDNCFVLHDLTKRSDARAKQILNQADAVIVLGRSELSEAVMQVAPGLNRGYQALVEDLTIDSNFTRIHIPATDGLPELSVYVRPARLKNVSAIVLRSAAGADPATVPDTFLKQAQEISKFEAQRRR